MLDIFWNKLCKDAGVVTKKEILQMEKQIERIEAEIADRIELIKVFEKETTVLAKQHVTRHKTGIETAKKEIAEIKEKIKNCKKEFDK